MITIKLKLDKKETSSLINMLLYIIRQCRPTNIDELCAMESWQKIANKLNAKIFSHKEKNIVSFSLAETIHFLSFGDVAYSKSGTYESAVWHRIKEDLQIKINREIQLRMI